MEKKKLVKVSPVFLLVLAAICLAASTVGSARAALTYHSEHYSAKVTLNHIGVTLVENDEGVSYRDYIADGSWDENTGVLVGKMLAEGEELVLGKTYKEELKVTNSGSIDTYVRVILTKSWKDAEGKKDQNLSPDLIELNLVTGDNGWMIDEEASTTERTILYYKDILSANESTPNFTDTLRINPSIATKVSETVKTDANGYKIITYTYEYDGYTFNIHAEVDAVQTHNVEDAIKSAWGVDVERAEDTSISLVE